ncbi:hypothetical protein C8F01DRAFT_773249 [Mycena amicta]|nr:hypothetical protein C8F01DRAFT_773249 [Mycena amicta]
MVQNRQGRLPILTTRPPRQRHIGPLRASLILPSTTNMTRASAVFLVALFCSSLVAAAPVAPQQSAQTDLAAGAPASDIPVAVEVATPEDHSAAVQANIAIPAPLASILAAEQSEYAPSFQCFGAAADVYFRAHSTHVPEFVHSAEKARRRSFRRRHP